MVAIVGFTRFEWRDWPWALTACVSVGIANRVRRKWEHSATVVWPPPNTLRQLHAIVDATIPGARVSRLLMGRYLIVWHAPSSR